LGLELSYLIPGKLRSPFKIDIGRREYLSYFSPKRVLRDLVSQFQLPAISMLKRICKQVKELLRSEPNVVNVTSPAYVVGNINGQFTDL